MQHWSSTLSKRRNCGKVANSLRHICSRPKPIMHVPCLKIEHRQMDFKSSNIISLLFMYVTIWEYEFIWSGKKHFKYKIFHPELKGLKRVWDADPSQFQDLIAEKAKIFEILTIFIHFRDIFLLEGRPGAYNSSLVTCTCTCNL